MSYIIYIFCYLFVGWAWATLVIYKDWKYYDEFHEFGFLWWLWPIDILRRIVIAISHQVERYHIWIVRKRIKHEKDT